MGREPRKHARSASDGQIYDGEKSEMSAKHETEDRVEFVR